MKLDKTNIFTIFLALIALVLFFQGFTQYALIPLSLVSMIVGVNSSSPIAFFIYPFALIVIRFLIIFIWAPITAASKDQSGAIKVASKFWIFLTDFFRWVMAIWFSMMLSGAMVAAGFIPNKDPPLFFVILSFYLAFFISFIILRRLLKGDYFDEIKNKVFGSNSDFISNLQNKELGISIFKKFFVYFFIILISLVLFFLFFAFVAPLLNYSHSRNVSIDTANTDISFFKEYGCPLNYARNISFFVPNEEIAFNEGDFKYIRKMGSKYCEPVRIRLVSIYSSSKTLDSEGNLINGDFTAKFFIEDSQQLLDSFELQAGGNSSLISQKWQIKEVIKLESIEVKESNKTAKIISHIV